MPVLGLNALDRTIQETNIWLNEIAEEMGGGHKQHAYHAMRGVLCTLRDRLPPDEALDLAAQLPILVRGIYFEGYNNVTNRPKKYDKQEFLGHVSRELEAGGRGDAERAVGAVLTVLERHVSPGMSQQLRRQMPGDLKELWPERS